MKKIFFYGLMGLVFLYCVFPFFWTISTALKPSGSVFSLPVRYLPQTVSLQNVRGVFNKRPFLTYILNSLVVAGGAVLFTLGSASLLAYHLRQLEIERASRVQRSLLILAIIPPALLVIPIFMAMVHLGLINSYLGLALSYTVLNFPFAVWMLHSAFRQLPRELEEAARIDGYSFLGRLFGIVLPLCKPSLSVTALLVFIFCWNEFIIALTLMPSQSRYTVPVGIALLSGASVYEMPWGEINAAVAITTLPVILIMAVFQRWIVEGLTAGAVKE